MKPPRRVETPKLEGGCEKPELLDYAVDTVSQTMVTERRNDRISFREAPHTLGPVE